MLTTKMIKNLILLILGMSRLVVMTSSRQIERAVHCEFYNGTNEEDAYTQTSCGKERPGERNHCFVLWEYNSVKEISAVKMKGCFYNNINCYEDSHCVRYNTDQISQLYFCCCNGDMCNRDLKFVPEEKPVLAPTDSTVRRQATMSQRTFHELVTVFIAGIVCVNLVILSIISWYRRRGKAEMSTNETTKMEIASVSEHYQNPALFIDFKEIKASGRFGAVWQATDINNKEIAVKVFFPQSYESWKNEQEIFKLPGMEHDDILNYIGVYEYRSKHFLSEFWLVTAYHSRGSLCDYLNRNVVTWKELCQVAYSIASGLAHLHQEIATAEGLIYKPSVAHRDFKSKNVLIKSDMTACIADFGLAMTFYPGRLNSCISLGRVGTIRYMAPEVLQGAINFSKESFLRIDMYACGLVLWELASCCIAHNGKVDQYRLPFEDEVGQQPNIQTMYDCVVEKKKRPVIPEHWREHKGLSEICRTIEECWDTDADARITSSCVFDRIANLLKLDL